MIRSKLQMRVETTGDEYIRLHTTGDEYVRVGIVQETSTYQCLEVRRRVHTTGDEYIRRETSTYDRRRVHTNWFMVFCSTIILRHGL